MCKWKSSTDDEFECSFKEQDYLGHCIFHKKNKTKDEIKLMKSYFDKEKNKNWYIKFIKKENDSRVLDFRGFEFEEEYYFDFSDILDKDFIYDFSYCNFKFDVSFDNQVLYGDLYFDSTIFYKNVTFQNSSFQNNVIFYGVCFKSKIKNLVFLETKFNGQNLIIKKCIGLPKIDGVKFSESTKFLIDKIGFYDNNNIIGRTYYRIARNQASKTGDYENIGRYYYTERYYNTKLITPSKYKTKKEYFINKSFDLMSKYVTGYGEKPLNIFLISFLLISFFAFMYMIVGIKSIQDEFVFVDIFEIYKYTYTELITSYLKAWYFSIVTFATVGYGDIFVHNVIGRLLVVTEIFLGLTMAASWATTLIKKMTR